jgi:hypothetical protein
MAILYPHGHANPQTNAYPATSPNAKERSQREPKFAEYEYHFTGSEAASDVIYLGLGSANAKFPKGTTVVPQLSYSFVETDCAVTLTLDVGDLDTAAASAAYLNGDAYAVAHVASDADRYCDGIDAGAVGIDAFANGVAAAIPHTLQEDCLLTCTFATLSTPSATGVLRLRIAYFTS